MRWAHGNAPCCGNGLQPVASADRQTVCITGATVFVRVNKEGLSSKFKAGLQTPSKTFLHFQ
jgi:hypothetical protein